MTPTKKLRPEIKMKDLAPSKDPAGGASLAPILAPIPVQFLQSNSSQLENAISNIEKAIASMSAANVQNIKG